MQLKEKILQLRKQGLSYDKIVKELGCAKSTVAYHCNQTSKDKSDIGRKHRRKNQHPLAKKLESFLYRYDYRTRRVKCTKRRWRQALHDKLRCFSRVENGSMPGRPDITVDEALEFFGDFPTCYLTGEPIDLERPSTYTLDHKIPHTRGGTNTLDNMGLCTMKANMAKGDMTPEEFIEFCKTVVDFN